MHDRSTHDGDLGLVFCFFMYVIYSMKEAANSVFCFFSFFFQSTIMLTMFLSVAFFVFLVREHKDQCQAMAAAIRSRLSETKHRWCRWHVLRNAKQKLGNVYTKHSGFKLEFHRLITHQVCKLKFERKCQLAQKYDLGKSKFMRCIFSKREMWAKPYFMGVFCAGMTSTQRNESANHILKRFIQSKDGNGSGSVRVEYLGTQNRNPNLKPEPDPNSNSGTNSNPKPKPVDTRNRTGNPKPEFFSNQQYKPATPFHHSKVIHYIVCSNTTA